MSIAVNVPPVSEAKKVRIFKIAQQAQVYRQTGCNPHFALPMHGGTRHKAGYEEIAHRNDSQQKEISTAAFIIEVVRKQGDEHQTGGGAALQKQVEQDKGCKQPQENAAAEYHRCMRIVHQQVVQAGKVYIQFVQKFANIPHRSVYG